MAERRTKEFYVVMAANDADSGKLLDKLGIVVTCECCESREEFARHHLKEVQEYLESKLDTSDFNNLLYATNVVMLESSEERDARVVYSVNFIEDKEEDDEDEESED